jgi:hypothetical protein
VGDILGALKRHPAKHLFESAVALALCLIPLNTAVAERTHSGSSAGSGSTNAFVGESRIDFTSDYFLRERMVAPGRKQVQLDVGYCSATLLSRKQEGSDPTQCRAAFWTAGHCIYNPNLKRNIGSHPLDTIRFYLPRSAGEPAVKLDQSSIVGIDSPYVREQNKSNDYAVVHIKTACGNLNQLRLTEAELAPLGPNGLPEVGQGEPLSLKTRNNAVSGNPGGGRAVRGTLTENGDGMVSTKVPEEFVGLIHSGDSGGAVTNSLGQVVGPLATATQLENDSKSIGFNFASNALRHAMQSLERNGYPVRPRNSSAVPRGALASFSPAPSLFASNPNAGSPANSGQVLAPSLASTPAPSLTHSPAPGFNSFAERRPAAAGLTELPFDAASLIPSSEANTLSSPAPELPGEPIAGLSLVCEDRSDQSALVKNPDSTWSSVYVGEDGKISLLDGKPISQEALKELLLAYADSADRTDFYVGDGMRLIKAALRHYAPQIQQWLSERQVDESEARSIAENNPGAQNGTFGPSDNPHVLSPVAEGGTDPSASTAASASSAHTGGGSSTPGGEAFGPPASASSPRIMASNDALQKQSAQLQAAMPAHNQAMREYEGLRYEVGDRAPRERFSYGFADIPQGGTGQIVFAYFGSRENPDLQRIVNEAGLSNLVVPKFYAPHTPEARHIAATNQQLARQGMSPINSVSIDGLGRKITRYSESLESNLAGLIRGPEPRRLQQYLAAKSQGQQLATVQNELKARQVGDARHTPSPGNRINLVSSEPRAPSSVGAGALPHGALTQCASCHAQEQGRVPALKNFTSVASIEAAFKNGTVTEGLLEGMFAHMQLQPRYNISAEDKQALRDFVLNRRERDPASLKGAQPAVTPRLQLMSSSDPRIPTLPKFTGPMGDFLSRHISGATFHTSKESPALALHFSPEGTAHVYETMTNGNHATFGDISQGNGNREFPWRNPGGTDHVTNGGSHVKFFIPPASGPMLVVKDMYKYVQTPKGPQLSAVGGAHHGDVNTPAMPTAEIQPGTVEGEVLTVKSPSGKSVPFQIRLHTMTPQGLKFDVLAPFEDSADLVRAVAAKAQWQKDPQVKAFLEKMKNPSSTLLVSDIAASFASPKARVNSETEKLGAGNRNVEDAVMMRKAIAQKLPPLPPALVEELLTTTPFKSVFGKPWVSTDKGEGWAPVADGFHIVPNGFSGHHIPMTQVSCASCHSATARHMDHKDPPMHRMTQIGFSDSQGNRDWYGHFRGTVQQPVAGHPGVTAGSFSLPVFDYSGPFVSPNGGKSVRPRAELERAGLLQWMSRQR